MGSALNNEMFSFNPAQLGALLRSRGAFPNVKGAGSANAALFRYTSVAGLSPLQPPDRTGWTPRTVLGRTLVVVLGRAIFVLAESGVPLEYE